MRRGGSFRPGFRQSAFSASVRAFYEAHLLRSPVAQLSCETILYGPDRGLGPVRQVQFSQDGLCMDLDGRFGDVEFAGDTLVRVAMRQAMQDFDLPRRQRVLAGFSLPGRFSSGGGRVHGLGGAFPAETIQQRRQRSGKHRSMGIIIYQQQSGAGEMAKQQSAGEDALLFVRQDQDDDLVGNLPDIRQQRKDLRQGPDGDPMRAASQLRLEAFAFFLWPNDGNLEVAAPIHVASSNIVPRVK